MANITTSLPIIIEENNNLQKYTKERTILSTSIEASLINYLPLDYSMSENHCRTSYINNTLTKMGSHFHMDFSNINYISGASIFLIDLTNIVNLEIDQTYTFSFRISNVGGTYNSSSFKYPWVIVKNSSDSGGKRISSDWYPKNGFYSFTFTPTDTVSYIVWGRNYSWITTKDLQFDIELIGLVKGEKPIQRSYNSFSTQPNISISNTNSVLGEYPISRDVRRHLLQVERNIQKQENTFNISWR